MRVLKKFVCIAMLCTIISSALCISSYAATAKTVRHYDTYLCLGDSIAAGYGPYNKEIRGLARVDVAYHAKIADSVTCDTFYPLARSGYRTAELRYMLDENYLGDDYMFQIYKMSQELIDEYRPIYKKALPEADLITINVGMNDLLNYGFAKALTVLYRESDPRIAEIEKLLEEEGDVGAAFSKLISTAETVEKLPEVATAFAEGIYKGYHNFISNWDGIMEHIYEVNPDVTVVAVGFFNSVQSIKLTNSSLLPIGRAFDIVLRMANQYIQSGNRFSGRYLFADVWDVETFEMAPMTDDAFLADIIAKSHPTLKGHQHMARRILSVLPADEEKVTCPYTDVDASSKYYDAVCDVYQNDVMDGTSRTTFSPNALATKAQVASALYKLSGCPDTGDMTIPFIDVKKSDPNYDAVVWAYNNGYIGGLTKRLFFPSLPVSHAQLADILFKFESSPETDDIKSPYLDVAESHWAHNAIVWAYHEDILHGATLRFFVPAAPVTRALLAEALSEILE